MAIFSVNEIGIKQAKNSLSKLVAAVQKGNEVFLLNRGERVAKIVPVRPPSVAGTERGLGMFKDKIRLPEGWGSQESRERAERQFLSTIEGLDR